MLKSLFGILIFLLCHTNAEANFSFGMESMGERATCRSYNGKTACGFNCVAYNGDVKCARTPYGKCLGYNGHISCGDPLWARRGMPKMECRGYNGKIACGYQCVGYNGNIRCSLDPWGTCLAHNGKITCSDDF